MKKTTILLLSLCTLSSCFNLDSLLYNQTKTSQYMLDNYSGKVDFTLDYSYHIPDSLVHVFTLPSQSSDESSSTEIYAIYIGNISRISTDTVIMYCHGNRDNMDFYWQRAKLLANTGSKNRFGVLMIDYRSYGMSQGKATEDGLYADVDAGLKWLSDKGLTNNRLVMYGFSLGTAPATKLTAEPKSMTPSKLILEAPFANAETLEQDATGVAMPGSFFSTLKIDNAEEIKNVQQPFFWTHGIADSFLQITTNGQLVFDNYQGTYKEAHKIPNAEHSTIETTWGFSSYSNALLTFITQH